MHKKWINILLILLIIFIISGTLLAYERCNISIVNKQEYIIYTVKPGDNLFLLARKYNTTVSKIKSVNNLQSDIIYIDQKLKIPGITEESSLIYYVKPGDSLYLIARKYGITIERLKRANNIWSDIIYVGQKLKIPGFQYEEGIVNYQVKAGDSLYLIARKFGTTIQRIKADNNLQSDIIYVGQKLEIKTEEKKKENSEEEQEKEVKEEVFTSVKGRLKISNKTAGIKPQTDKVNSKEVLPLSINDSTTKFENEEVIIKYKPMINTQAKDKLEREENLSKLNELETGEGKIVHYRISAGKEIEEIVEKYNKLEHVEWAEPNYIYYPTAVPNDAYYDFHQWDYIKLNLEAAWDVEKGNSSVTVAVLDTGIIPDHPDLGGNLLQGADFVGGNNSYPVLDYERTDSDPTDETAKELGGSHGTHVAGIIGAITDNYRGVAGINWDVKILPVRILRKTGGTSWDVAEGIYYAIDQGVDIINMSLGGNSYSHLQEQAVKKAINSGITVIAAAGNESSSVYYPAALDGVIAVGSTGKDNSLAYYSNYGPEIDVVAPGGDYGESIYSTWGYYDQGETVSGYVGMIGTSMATPHVSGIAALMVAKGIKDPQEIKSRLINTARDLGHRGKDNYYGYGLVDAYGALLNKKLEKPVVFAATKGGDTLTLMSEMKTVNEDGSFILEKVKSGEVYIIGWRDVNENDIVDRGDYYGETREPLVLSGTSEQGLDLSINYISDSFLKTGYKISRY